MKLAMALFTALLSSWSSWSFAQDISLNDYNYTVTDVARRGLTKETIFQGMDRSFIKLGSSICSNRALIWAHNMEREYHINTAKLFLFYTEKIGEAGDKRWWYHVTPMVNENGELWTVDAGFPHFVNRPMSIPDWLHKFAGSSNCKELQIGDDDLIENAFAMHQFPNVSRHGNFDCYYRITSAPYWTPSTVAQQMLGRNSRGVPGSYERDNIKPGELLQACMEASTTPIGGFFNNPRKKCLQYLGL